MNFAECGPRNPRGSTEVVSGRVASFRTKLLEENVLQMDYRSDRAMGALAHGLIEACGEHYGENFDIEYQPQTEDGKHVRFVIHKNA